MIVRTKPLKIKLKQTQEPLEDFMLIHKNDPCAVSKEVLFVRYIGIPHSIELYQENILNIDQHFASHAANVAYLRLQGLATPTNTSDIHRLSTIWDNWQTIINSPMTDAAALYQQSLCSPLDNETLEWTKKIAFMDSLSMYKKMNAHANATLFKNFGIKFLYWLDIYLPKLFKPTHLAPKLLFIGAIKQHEVFFLYFLSRLGCDICYMNPKEDIISLHSELETYSTAHQCSTLYPNHFTMPAFTPPPRIEQTSLPQASNTRMRNTVKQPQPQAVELSYEQLAGFSSSVVMIKVYDEEQNIVCGGSGVVIHSKGYILTNLHVVGGGHYYSVLYENETEEYFTDHFIKYHQQYDLAIIKVEKNCSPLPVKTDRSLVRGQKIVAIGSPLGLFNSVSDGIVSGFREIDGIPMIQFTAPISSGSSGGALLDMFGRLVGLITAGFSKGQNLNLAVPADIIYQFAENFIEYS